MTPSSSSLDSLPWPVLLLGAWLATVMVVAVLAYGIAKAAINKTDARDLPAVLTALTQVVGGITGPLDRIAIAAHKPLNALVQNAESQEQTGGQSGSTEVAQ
jgi:hypothetical protein